LEILNEEWGIAPPERFTLAALVGHKPKEKGGDLSELIAMFPGGTIKGK
jgi:hypothetical protein